MPTLTQLSYIVAVDIHRHFGKASRACHVSQPTLSMQLKKAEEELGVSIFDRSRQPIVPTTRGMIIIGQARKILSELQKLETIGKSGSAEPQGSFRLGVIPTLSPYLIPLFLPYFSKTYPKVELTIDELKTEEIISRLDLEQIDAGILVTPLGQPSIREQVLFYEPFYLFVSESHEFFKKKRIKESDLSAEDIWLLDEGHCLRDQVIQLCGTTKKRRLMPNVHFQSSNLETLKRLVEQNSGYTLLPYLSFMQDRSSKVQSLIREFLKPIPSREVSIVFGRDHLKEEIRTAIIDSILRVLPKDLPKTKQNLEVMPVAQSEEL